MSVVAELPARFGLTATRRARRRMPGLVALSFLVLAVVVVCAIFGESIAPGSPHEQRLLVGDKPPSAEFWAGTDLLGRDVLSRVIVGARTALIGPIVVAVTAFAIATLLFSAFVVLLNLAIDVIYTLIDPRIRFGRVQS